MQNNSESKSFSNFFFLNLRQQCGIPLFSLLSSSAVGARRAACNQFPRRRSTVNCFFFSFLRRGVRRIAAISKRLTVKSSCRVALLESFLKIYFSFVHIVKPVHESKTDITVLNKFITSDCPNQSYKSHDIYEQVRIYSYFCLLCIVTWCHLWKPAHVVYLRGISKMAAAQGNTFWLSTTKSLSFSREVRLSYGKGLVGKLKVYVWILI